MSNQELTEGEKQRRDELIECLKVVSFEAKPSHTIAELKAEWDKVGKAIEELNSMGPLDFTDFQD